MKNKNLAMVFIGLMMLASFSIASSANPSSPEDDSCCCCCCSSNCKMMSALGCEDIEWKVENTKEGVIIEITSENEDVVKKVQNMCGKMKEMCEQKECCKEESKKEKNDR